MSAKMPCVCGGVFENPLTIWKGATDAGVGQTLSLIVCSMCVEDRWSGMCYIPVTIEICTFESDAEWTGRHCRNDREDKR